MRKLSFWRGAASPVELSNEQSVIDFVWIRNSTRILVVGLLATLFIYMPSEVHAGQDAAVKFMNRVAKDLMTAVRSKSTAKMANAISRYADIPLIAHYSLGSYASKLPSTRRSLYHKGVAQFMARYFMIQAREYKVVSAKILPPSFREGKDVMVESAIILDSGEDYRVRWRLSRRNGRYKVADVRVLGFWLMPFQRTMFNEYIEKHNGNVNALVAALTY